jgi:hypothetical protein
MNIIAARTIEETGRIVTLFLVDFSRELGRKSGAVQSKESRRNA